jgi:hypothetical protein
LSEEKAMNDPRETNPPAGAPKPGPKEQESSVYGGTWGESGKQNPQNGGSDAPDRPDRIVPPAETE